MDPSTLKIDASNHRLRRVGRLTRRRMRIEGANLTNGIHTDGRLSVVISGLGGRWHGSSRDVPVVVRPAGRTRDHPIGRRRRRRRRSRPGRSAGARGTRGRATVPESATSPSAYDTEPRASRHRCPGAPRLPSRRSWPGCSGRPRRPDPRHHAYSPASIAPVPPPTRPTALEARVPLVGPGLRNIRSPTIERSAIRGPRAGGLIPLASRSRITRPRWPR